MRDHANEPTGRLVLEATGHLHDPVLRDQLARMAGGTDVAQLEALAALRLAAKQVHAATERWTEGHGLSESRLRLLMALYFSPDRRRPLRELAEALNVVPRTVTDIADTLERDDLIRRVPDANDRRSVHAQLTDAGVERVEVLRRDMLEQQARLLAGFSSEQLAELRHLCLLLIERLHESAGD
ncbi:MAG TPA: MarR family transcriptional regulator [Candidatus Dormibacteraeota bacterium]|nr:MarR family transcriptional regulator [Candidatus Dormibacteraeota bacterium]